MTFEMLVVSLYHLSSPSSVCCHGGHHESTAIDSCGVGTCACKCLIKCEIVYEIPDHIIFKEKCEKMKADCIPGRAEWAASKF